MPDFTALQTRVQRRVIDLPATVLAEVPDLINEAIHELEVAHNFTVMKALTEVTTDSTAGDGGRLLIAKPTDFKEFRGHPWRRAELGTATDMLIAPNRSDVERTYGVALTDTGAPRALLNAEEDEDGVGNWELWPLPDTLSDYTAAPIGEYRIVIPYWKHLPALSAGTDSNWFTVNAHKFIIDKATAEAFALNWDEQRSVLWEQKAAARRAEVIKLEKLRHVSGMKSLVVHRGARETKSGAGN